MLFAVQGGQQSIADDLMLNLQVWDGHDNRRWRRGQKNVFNVGCVADLNLVFNVICTPVKHAMLESILSSTRSGQLSSTAKACQLQQV